MGHVTRALCMVAHPDDCVIFAMPYIMNHRAYDWTIGYLTYTAHSDRGREIMAFWQRRGVDCVFLGFEDHWHDQEQQRFTRWDPTDAKSACQNLATQFDLVLTHAADGEYGHIHHVLVHEAVKTCDEIITFARPGTSHIRFSIDRSQLNLEELPMHRAVIEQILHQQPFNYYQELEK